MATYNICLLGFGNVGRALARLFVNKRAELREFYGIEWRITGVATRRLGWHVNEQGFEDDVLTRGTFEGTDGKRARDFDEWLRLSRPQALLETTSLNVETGQPAIDYLSVALRAGAHAITANKGTVVYGYQQLNGLAQQMGKQ